jgi:hypothetical protein
MTDDLPATLDELTVQQEDFAQMYAKCGNATRSYIATYGTKGDASKVAVRIAASRLANNPAVAARIHALRTAIRSRHRAPIDPCEGVCMPALPWHRRQIRMAGRRGIHRRCGALGSDT